MNGVRLSKDEPIALDDGAVIRLGRTVLVYRSDYAGPAIASPPIGTLVSPFGMWRVRDELSRIAARNPANVLIEGETGTGKELIAAEVAKRMNRDKKFATVNVAGIPAGVFESQLFGYIPGAFSGSGRGSPGVFLEHDGGAVFLDEIGELSLDLQPKLLRLLDNREVLQVGATRPQRVDVLVIAATNRSLPEMVEQGRFRRDLHARLIAAVVELPPLRERREDIFAIAEKAASRSGAGWNEDSLEPEAIELLLLHPWPSNVRELLAAVDRIAAVHPRAELKQWAVERVLGPLERRHIVTRELVEQTLAREKNNESAAARALGITRGKLRRILGRA